MGVRQRPGGAARSRGSLWGCVLAALGTAPMAVPCEMPCPDVMFITQHKEHLQKVELGLLVAKDALEGLCKSKGVWFISLFSLLTDGCHCTWTQASSGAG